MTPATTAAPASSTAPQWEPIAEAPSSRPAARAPARDAVPISADEAIVNQAVVRRGLPVLAATGWALAFLGLLVIAFAYQRSFANDALYRVAGIRADLLGGAIVLIGWIVAGAFHFVPARRAVGVEPNAPHEELERAAHVASRSVRTSQLMVGTGVGLSMLGLVWMIYWLYRSYTENALLVSVVSRYETPTHYFGAAAVLVGLLLAFFFWGRVGVARVARNLGVVALQRALSSAPGGAALPSGVTETEIQNLMKRLDGLMAQLPDAAVTEFSRMPEADTYLKLLGS